MFGKKVVPDTEENAEDVVVQNVPYIMNVWIRIMKDFFVQGEVQNVVLKKRMFMLTLSKRN